MIAEFTNHLWQSTLFAAVAALLSIALRENRARVRYGLWLSASLKFLVPFGLLIRLGHQLESLPAARRVVTQIGSVSVSAAVDRVAQPFSEAFISTSATLPSAGNTGTSRLVLMILGLWMLGFCALVTTRLRTWAGIRRAVRTSLPVRLQIPVPVRHSSRLLEPGVVGLLRPVLLLPEGILQRLTPRQLEAVLAHELCHVRRHDNLTAALHMFVETVFWFHPLVWWIGARLVEERERACDEEVLRLGNEPLTYAEGILNVCKFYQESPLVCVSGVTGSDLKTRIEYIMRNRAASELNFGKALFLVIFGVLALAVPIAAGVVHGASGPVPALLTAPQTPAAQDTFEVVSIRPADPNNAPGGGGRGGGGGGRGGAPSTPTPCGPVAPTGGIQIDPGRITLRNATLFRIITLAYGKNCRAMNEIGLISGLPEWTATQAFDIQATFPAGSPYYTARQLIEGDAPTLQGMLRNMLADRFHLTLHRGSKEANLYNLVVVRTGRIKLSDDQTPPPPPAPPSGPVVPQGPVVLPGPSSPLPRGGFSLQVDPPAGKVTLEANAIPIKTLINVFQGQEARFVVDNTGLKGLYDIPSVNLDVGAFDIGPNAVSVWPEIMQQLGLKLEPARGPLETLIIDRLEKPSEN